jgi:hypothetical protein
MLFEVLSGFYHNLSGKYGNLWELRDRRMEGLPLMGSPWPTVAICLAYVYVVKVWGPNYMRDRKPFEMKSFLIGYNAFQVVLSAYMFIEVRSGRTYRKTLLTLFC